GRATRTCVSRLTTRTRRRSPTISACGRFTPKRRSGRSTGTGRSRSFPTRPYAPRATPLREFLRTETGSAAVLLAAALAALVWVNVDASSYDSVWHTAFTLRLREWTLTQDLRGWVNEGLMTFFFFVVGLEARREFDMGELRERRRVALPLLAGLGGMAVPVLIYLAFTAGRGSAPGWGTALSTDTAPAL